MFNYKRNKIPIVLLSFAILAGSVYYAVGAYTEPFSAIVEPAVKIDIGPATSTKSGNLSIVSSSGTTTLTTQSQLMFAPTGAAPGVINVQTVSGVDNPIPAAQSPLLNSGKSVPLGFLWNRGSGGLLSTNQDIAVGTSSSYWLFTLANGTASSSVVNFAADPNNTIAVGAYYNYISRSWKTLNPPSSGLAQPMAIAFDPNAGLLLSAGARLLDTSGTIAWRSSMKVDNGGNVTFSDLFNYDNETVWQGIIVISKDNANAVTGPVYTAEDYCKRPDVAAAAASSGANCLGTDKNGNKFISFIPSIPGAILQPLPNETCNAGDTINFYPFKEQSGDTWLQYQCATGVNDPRNNKATTTVGNLFVANQTYSDSKSPTANGQTDYQVLACTYARNYTLGGTSAECYEKILGLFKYDDTVYCPSGYTINERTNEDYVVCSAPLTGSIDPGRDIWAYCPDGYFMTSVGEGSGGLYTSQCSKL